MRWQAASLEETKVLQETCMTRKVRHCGEGLLQVLRVAVGRQAEWGTRVGHQGLQAKLALGLGRSGQLFCQRTELRWEGSGTEGRQAFWGAPQSASPALLESSLWLTGCSRY